MRPLSSCRTLCETLEELPLLFVVSSHKLFMELLKEEERKVLVEQLRKRSATINLSAKPLPSFYDIPGTALRIVLMLTIRWHPDYGFVVRKALSGVFQSLKACVFIAPQLQRVWTLGSWSSSSSSYWSRAGSDRSSSNSTAWPNDPSGGSTVRSEVNRVIPEEKVLISKTFIY